MIRGILVGLGVLLLAVSLFCAYANQAFISNNGFADHATAALQNTQVQNALAQVMADKIVAQLPPVARLSSPIVQRAAQAVVSSEQFSKVFRAVVLRTHKAALSEHNNQILLNMSREAAVIVGYLSTLDPKLAPKLAPIQKHLAKIGGSNALLPVIRVLKKVQSLSIWAMILAIIAFVLALVLSPMRSRTLRNIGLWLTILGGLMWLAVKVVGWVPTLFLSGMVAQVYPGVWSAFATDLAREGAVLAVFGLVLIAAASKTVSIPVSSRDWSGLWQSRAEWVQSTKVRIAAAVVALILGALILLEPRTVFSVIVFVIGAAIVYWAISTVMEVVGGPPAGVERAPKSADIMTAGRWTIAVLASIVVLVMWGHIILSA